MNCDFCLFGSAVGRMDMSDGDVSASLLQGLIHPASILPFSFSFLVLFPKRRDVQW